MKTPREILFAQHRAAEPKLDAISRQVASANCPRARSWPLSFFTDFCREIIWPARRIWIALAAAWILILAVALDFRANTPKNGPPISPDQAALLFHSTDSELWMAESVKLPAPPAARSRQPPPPPRAQCAEQTLLI